MCCWIIALSICKKQLIFGLINVGLEIMNHSSVTSLFNYWEKQGLNLEPGLASQKIHLFEKKSNLKLSEEFRGYLQKYNGFKPSPDLDNLDANGFEFLPLAEERVVLNNYFVFCIWHYGFLNYAICLENSPENGKVMLLINDSRGYIVAKTFADFIEIYLSDAECLYKPTENAVSL